jgi:prepilin peptidase CpaA
VLRLRVFRAVSLSEYIEIPPAELGVFYVTDDLQFAPGRPIEYRWSIKTRYVLLKRATRLFRAAWPWPRLDLREHPVVQAWFERLIGGLRVHQSVIIEALILSGIGVLAFSALHDFAVRTVPNCASLVLLALGVAWRLEDGGRLLSWSAGIAGAILLITFVFWRLGWMGGGDVKLLAAAGMFVPPWLVPMMISGTAVAGGLLALVYLVASRLVPTPHGPRPPSFIGRVLRCEQWRMARRGPLPYAAAIAAGGVIATLQM